MAVKAVTIGFFDGVHIGHRRVLMELLSRDAEATVVTFWPHPRAVLQQDARGLCMLNSYDEKVEAMRAIGVENVECIDFTRDFALMKAETFMKEYLIGELGCTCLVLGYDNRLGSDGLSTEQVAALGEKMGLDVQIVPPCMMDGVTVSSTRIREALSHGDVELSGRMLGANYSLKGMVVPGNQKGRSIGFPTANILPSFPLKAIPADGVYATRVIVEGVRYDGMTNIGVRPTLSCGNSRTIETNIFEFDKDIYGLEVELEFVSRIRQERKFESLDQLRGQLEKDKMTALKLF